MYYSHKFKGNKAFSHDDLQQILHYKPNQSLFYKAFKPSLAFYLLAERDTLGFLRPYNQEKIKAKIEKIKIKYDKKLSKTDSLNQDKILKITRKKTKKLNQQQEKINQGNWVMKNMGEKPTLFDEQKIKNNIHTIENHLQANGYLNAKANYEIKTKSYRRKVIYNINENQGFKVLSVKIDCDNNDIQTIVNKDRKQSLLKEGKLFSVDDITKERSRLNKIIRSQGYYKFSKDNLIFSIDTLSSRKNTQITIKIDDENDSLSFKKYFIKDIYFFLDKENNPDLKPEKYKDIHFIANDKKFSKKLIYNTLRVKKGQEYSTTRLNNTQIQLGNVDVFKYININFVEEKDSLVMMIYASSAKKFQVTNEAGVNLNVSSGQSLPGPFFNVSFKNRKVFSGFEIFEANVRYAFAGQININESEVFRSQELGLNTALKFPRLVGPLVLQSKILPKYSKTSIWNLGYSSVNRVEYTRRSLSTSLNYQLLRKNKKLTISPIDFNYLRAFDLTDDFTTMLVELAKGGNSIINSFNSSIITSMKINYTFNNNDPTVNKHSYYVNISSELGGALLNKYLNGEDKLFNLPYYQFYKLNLDMRFYEPVTTNGTFAFRLNAGIAKPYGNSTNLPYDKHYFIGGLNSVRAWAPRRLGPGSHLSVNANGKPYVVEQPGEVILESSMELRQKLIGPFQIALFIDAGNIWMIEDKNKDAEFNKNTFFKQIAVGSGIGFRLDFSFIIIRLDIGIKVYDPARKDSEHFVPLTDPYSRAYNLGIGYPF